MERKHQINREQIQIINAACNEIVEAINCVANVSHLPYEPHTVYLDIGDRAADADRAAIFSDATAIPADHDLIAPEGWEQSDRQRGFWIYRILPASERRDNEIGMAMDILNGFNGAGILDT